MFQSLKTKYAAHHGIRLLGQINFQIAVVSAPERLPDYLAVDSALHRI